MVDTKLELSADGIIADGKEAWNYVFSGADTASGVAYDNSLWIRDKNDAS